jgi:hypothetical protein
MESILFDATHPVTHFPFIEFMIVSAVLEGPMTMMAGCSRRGSR